MGFLSKLITTLLGKEHHQSGVTDPTVYTIQTCTHFYTCRIIFQDEKIMRVWILNKMKTVKILKENIIKISIDDKSNYTQAKTTQLNWKSLVNPAI